MSRLTVAARVSRFLFGVALLIALAAGVQVSLGVLALAAVVLAASAFTR